MKNVLKFLIFMFTFYLFGVGAIAQPQSPPPSASPSPKENQVEVFKGKKTEKSINRASRTIRLSVTVDSISHLQVKEGEQIREGAVISDNSVERDRLSKQRKSIDLQINNLKSKPILKPNTPTPPPKTNPIPPANFAEEQAAITQAQMRVTQAKSLLEARTPLLTADNPERRAEAENTEADLRLATEKVEEQQQLLQAMKDRDIEAPPIIEHESTKLKQLEGELEKAKSTVEQTRAKLNASGIDQQQQLQQLQLAVQISQSELELARSRLLASQSRRQLIEYAASVDTVERAQRLTQVQQEYDRQSQIYEQAVRDRDYQLAQLSLSLAAVDEKLSQIPVVRSPKNGYIRRIKPWVGNNGKYATTITISSSNNLASAK